MNIETTHYQVWFEGDTFWRVYFHVRRGHGRSARRRLTGVYQIPKPQQPHSSPDLLRLLAQAVEDAHPTYERTREALSAPPRGPQGESLNLDLKE